MKYNIPGRRTGLRIKLADAGRANDLITNGVFLNHEYLKVSRYRPEGMSKGRRKNPYFEIPLTSESKYKEDRIDESDSPSSPEPALLQEEPVHMQTGPAAEEATKESGSDSESRKRPREPSLLGLRDTARS